MMPKTLSSTVAIRLNEAWNCYNKAVSPGTPTDTFFDDGDVDRAQLELATFVEDISPNESVTELPAPLSEDSPTEATTGELTPRPFCLVLMVLFITFVTNQG
jgi:hypothetical protein